MNRARVPVLAALGILLGAAAGCGDKSKYVPVSGVVKLNGKPYPNAAVFFQHEGALPLDVVRDLGMQESFFGWMFTINTVLIVLFEVRLNLSTSHWSHGRSLATGGLFLAAGFGAMALTTSASGVALTVVIWTIGEMILLPSMSNFVAEIAPADRRGEYMGLYSMSFAGTAPIGNIVAGSLAERIGLAATLSLNAALIVAAGLFARRRLHNHPEALFGLMRSLSR